MTAIVKAVDEWIYGHLKTIRQQFGDWVELIACQGTAQILKLKPFIDSLNLKPAALVRLADELSRLPDLKAVLAQIC
jgi:hypothetical protein